MLNSYMKKPTNPLISVIVPVYNVRMYLSECVNSIVRQTYNRLEIILVDDGSTDGSGALCDELAGTDERIRVIHIENGGPGIARNEGLKLATGEYVGFVDSDDWIEPDMYESLLAALGTVSADIAICTHFVEQGGQTVAKYVSDKMQIFKRKSAMEALIADKMVRNFLWDKLYKRSLFVGLEFPSYRVYEDVGIQYKLFSRARLVVVNCHPKYHYRQHSESTMAQKFDPERGFHLFQLFAEQNEFALHELSCEGGKALVVKRGIRLVERLMLFRRRPSVDAISERVLKIVREYDEMGFDQLGVYLAMKRSFLYNFPSAYRMGYRFLRQIVRSKRYPVEADIY